MRMCSIASGSSGNCIYVGSNDTHLLVDTGISKKRIEEGLRELEIKGEELNGILITHEHSDHIQGLGVFSRRFRSMRRWEPSRGSGAIRDLESSLRGCSIRYVRTSRLCSETSRSIPSESPMMPMSRRDTA